MNNLPFIFFFISLAFMVSIISINETLDKFIFVFGYIALMLTFIAFVLMTIEQTKDK